MGILQKNFCSNLIFIDYSEHSVSMIQEYQHNFFCSQSNKPMIRIGGFKSIKIFQNADALYTAGTVYRTASVSPITGSEFTGGLRMQIQGALGPDLQINGVLSDQNLPIQPEGNTKTLDEIDKVYLQVNHDNFLITAGDIDVSYSSGKFMNVDRKMIGLNNNFKYKEWSGNAVFAGSKGKLNQIT